MKYLPACLFLFILSTSFALADIGESAEQIVKRFGKPDRVQAVPGGKKLWWRSFRDYEVTVWLVSRNNNVLSVREEYRKAGSRNLSKAQAKAILKDYGEGKAGWQKIKTTHHAPTSGSMVKSTNTHFASNAVSEPLILQPSPLNQSIHSTIDPINITTQR